METFITYLSLFLGALGILASYVFYRRSIRAKEPVYSIRSNNLISNSSSMLENLTVLYRDYKVENLTVSKVLFYNRGADTITQEHLQTENPCKVVAKKDVEILDASILQTNNPSSHFMLEGFPTGKNNHVAIQFKYLDKNQGVVYQIIHTGTSSKDITVDGDIMGVPKIANIPPSRILSSDAHRTLRALLLFAGLCVMLIFGIFLSPVSDNPVIGVALWSVGAVGLFFVGVFASRRGLSNTMLLSGAIPNGLEKFLE